MMSLCVCLSVAKKKKKEFFCFCSVCSNGLNDESDIL